MKIIKRSGSALLALGILLSLLVPAWAAQEETRIVRLSTREDLEQLALDCILDSYSVGLTVSLEADISLSGEEFSPIPIFSGTFEGNGHKITGFTLRTDGSHQGFFRYLTESAEIKDLKVEGTVTPEGTEAQIGGIAGVNDGLIRNCSFTGTVSGKNYVGGIAGVNNGQIVACTANGTVLGKRFTGGIAGYCAQGAVISGCNNTASVNTEITEGGIDVDKLNITNALDSMNLVSIQDNNVVADTGGIVGYTQGDVDSCRNEGVVGYAHYGYNTGGIAGRQAGYLHGCVNNNEVLGKNDVGGIVGQMEPFLILLNQATLGDAISAVTGAMFTALSNLSGNADVMSAPVSELGNEARLIADFYTNPETEYKQEDVDKAYNDMGIQIQKLNESVNATIKTAAGDMQNVNAAFYSMMNLISYALSGNMTTELYEDVSDDSKETDVDGRVSNNVNYAAIEGDSNVGGIVGNMAVELEFDMEGVLLESFQETIDSGISMKKYQSKAVSYNNINNGAVTSKKDCCGGIVGYQDVGTVSHCENYAPVTSQEGFSGGIAGRSNAVVRSSYAMCVVDAAEYAGGICGYGETVVNCGSLVRMDNATAAFGAICGYAYGMTEENFGGNVFVSKDLGAVDGISYDGLAQSESYSEFISDENVPERMKNLEITFTADGKLVKRVNFTYGGSIPASAVPEVPDKTGYSGKWPDFDFSEIYFSETLDAEYTPHLGAVASEPRETDEELPMIVVDGDFDTSATVSTEPYTVTATPEVGENDTLLEAFTIKIDDDTEHAGTYSIRYLSPETEENTNHTVVIYKLEEDGSWTKLDPETLGSYLSFDSEGKTVTICAYDRLDKKSVGLEVILGGAALAAVLTILIVKLVSKRKARKNGETNGEQSTDEETPDRTERGEETKETAAQEDTASDVVNTQEEPTPSEDPPTQKCAPETIPEGEQKETDSSSQEKAEDEPGEKGADTAQEEPGEEASDTAPEEPGQSEAYDADKYDW